MADPGQFESVTAAEAGAARAAAGPSARDLEAVYDIPYRSAPCWGGRRCRYRSC
jgi:hypothetical protein